MQQQQQQQQQQHKKDIFSVLLWKESSCAHDDDDDDGEEGAVMIKDWALGPNKINSEEQNEKMFYLLKLFFLIWKKNDSYLIGRVTL